MRAAPNRPLHVTAAAFRFSGFKVSPAAPWKPLYGKPWKVPYGHRNPKSASIALFSSPIRIGQAEKSFKLAENVDLQFLTLKNLSSPVMKV